MRTYYRDPHVLITSTTFTIDGVRFRLDDLDGVWRTRRSVAGRRVLIGLGIVALAVLTRLAASYVWWLGGLDRAIRRWLTGDWVHLTIVTVIGLVFAIIGVLAVEAMLSGIEDIRGHSRHLELWATMSGRPVLLFRTNDSARFGQVCRALMRARADMTG
jgi:uncharacterized membrane protein YidH (DUF202 family)